MEIPEGVASRVAFQCGNLPVIICLWASNRPQVTQRQNLFQEIKKQHPHVVIADGEGEQGPLEGTFAIVTENKETAKAIRQSLNEISKNLNISRLVSEVGTLNNSFYLEPQ